MSAFLELRNVIRARHDMLKIKIKQCRDDEQLRLLKARKTEIWDLWHDFLFAGPSPYQAKPNNQQPPAASDGSATKKP